jgi:hypothetical protein
MDLMDLTCRTAECQDTTIRTQFAEVDQEKRRRETASKDQEPSLKSSLRESVMDQTDLTCKTAESQDTTTRTQFAEVDQEKRRRETASKDQEPSLKSSLRESVMDQTDLTCKTAESQDTTTRTQFAEVDQEKRRKETALIDQDPLLKSFQPAMDTTDHPALHAEMALEIPNKSAMDKMDNLELTAQLVSLMAVLASQFVIAPTEHLKFTADLDSQSAMEPTDLLDLAAQNSQSVMDTMENLLFIAEFTKLEISQFAMDQMEPKELTAQLHSLSRRLRTSQPAQDTTDHPDLHAEMV